MVTGLIRSGVSYKEWLKTSANIKLALPHEQTQQRKAIAPAEDLDLSVTILNANTFWVPTERCQKLSCTSSCHWCLVKFSVLLTWFFKQNKTLMHLRSSALESCILLNRKNGFGANLVCKNSSYLCLQQTFSNATQKQKHAHFQVELSGTVSISWYVIRYCLGFWLV